MKVAVFGAGATGGYLGLRLAQVGVETTLIARGPHLEAMRQDGVTVITDKGELNARPFSTDDPAEAGPQDYVIVTLKAHATPGAVDAMQPLLGPNTAVVTAQNGVPWWYFYRSGGDFDGHRLDSVDPGGKQWDGIGPERAIGCVVYPATEIVAPGVIRHLSEDRLTLGEPSGESTKRVETLRHILAEAGFRARVRPIRDEIWVKLWGNVAFNPISALTLATLDRIASELGTRTVAKSMMAEAQQVGEALGVRFRISLEKRIDGTGKVGAHRTSMLQDLQAGRPLEIDAMGAAVQEMAGLVGTPTPTIDLVLALLRQRAMAAPTAEDALAWVAPLRRRTARAASTAVNWLHDMGQGALTTLLATNLNDMLAQLVKGAPTIYDKAMDAEFLRTWIGGRLHRVFDGGHTPWGAFKAARNAGIDDSIITRAKEITFSLFRDVTTTAGLPFFTWNEDAYHKIADWLKATFGMPKKWFEDLVTYDAADIVSGLLGSAALLFRWNDGEVRHFARIFASTGLVAILKRNPIVGVVAFTALAKAFTEGRKTGDYEGCVKELAEGAAGTAVPMIVVPLVVAAGGPASVALAASILAGITVTVLAKKADDTGVLSDLASRIATLTSAAAEEAEEHLKKIGRPPGRKRLIRSAKPAIRKLLGRGNDPPGQATRKLLGRGDDPPGTE